LSVNQQLLKNILPFTGYIFFNTFLLELELEPPKLKSLEPEPPKWAALTTLVRDGDSDSCGDGG